MLSNNNIPFKISQKLNFSLAVFDSLPNHVFIKALNGEYLYCNQVMAYDLGLPSALAVVGLCDSDLVWTRFAKGLRTNDTVVLHKQEEIVFIEPVCLDSTVNIELKSYKSPLKDADNNLIGVMGFSYVLSSKSNKDNVARHNTQLSKRQVQCLNLLIKGLTAKEIAKNLNLSHRTVNGHIDSAKIKLKCRNKAELIATFSHTFNL